ncbi:MAG: hypothetical protein K9J37_11365 [Saprospiraceae bacterium]|nr:hypothetical protein [Saprospiraceae bacterium]MCF8250504.1 hypothetical protein [Saprospiraceae bacterium]MCF8279644.1 hypothetical protein [Bacteroidales bacterium]MCF8312430.1 hypothetical protein [Saprospiraceae bacterium]MCF8440753.1 hypothetical protein [Saprospiraceae bacterium]
MNSNKGFIAISSVLLPVLILLGFHTYNLNSERAAKAHKIELLEDEIRDFGILKNYLLEQVDSLQRTYNMLVTENASLYVSSEAARQELEEKTALIKNLETIAPDSKDVSTLKSKVEGLLKLKAILERDIANLHSGNVQPQL